MELVRREHGVQLQYKKAWRTKEEAQILARGTPKDSYFNLVKWLFLAQEKNSGTVAYLEMDAKKKIQIRVYCIWQSIRGFALMRRVIAVDGTFLKGKFTKILLAATAQDGDFHL